MKPVVADGENTENGERSQISRLCNPCLGDVYALVCGFSQWEAVNINVMQSAL